MTITTNRLVELSITSDPTAALIGTTWSVSGGDLLSVVDATMDAEIVGTLGVMQPGDAVDLDGDGTFEGTYEGRFNYGESTFTLGDGSTLTSALNIIEITVGGTSQYFILVSDTIAGDLDTNDLVSVTIGPNFATSPNTAGLNFDDANSYLLVCFAEGTLIETDQGQRPVEELSVGDLVRTKDNGPKPIHWIASVRLTPKDLAQNPQWCAIRITAGALGPGTPETDLVVSPQHRVLARSKVAERMFGSPEVLVAAKHLLSLDGIDLVEGDVEVTYYHFLFDQHEVIYSNGAETESMFTGPQALKSVSAETRAEILGLFPELADVDYEALSCRPVATGRQGRRFAYRLKKNEKAVQSEMGAV